MKTFHLMLTLKALALTAVVIMTGCASAPTVEQMRAATANYQLPKLPEDGKAIVYVVRPGGPGGSIRFNVFVDDQEAASEVGFTRGSQYIYFNLKPGQHSVLSKAENWATAVVTVKATLNKSTAAVRQAL